MIKSKPCIVDECHSYRFAKGYCKYHQYLRTDRKKTSSKIVKKATGEKLLFQTIYNTRERVSFLSGKKIFGVVSNFAHVLPKGLYPEYRLYDKNIILLTPQEHYLFDFGTEEQREKYTKENNCSWDEIYKLREELKEEYNGNG